MTEQYAQYISMPKSTEILMLNLRNLVLCSLLLVVVACGGSSEAEKPQRGSGHSGMPPGMAGGMGKPAQAAAVPVQVDTVRRGSISQYLETNGTLEAENEVDLVARTAGPITELLAEEGDTLARGTLLARIDDREARNQVANATVSRDEAKLAYERTQTTFDKGLVSQEAYDSAFSQLRSTQVQLENAEIQLAYTEIRAPFGSLVVARYIKQAQYVTSGTPLFRVSDFTPLLCPIEVPEKDLRRLRKGQAARIEVEAFEDEPFEAKVLRIRPTVDAATGTVTVTLAVDGRGQLRPGMFASVFLETDTHANVLVIPRAALVLDSIGDTVFIRNGNIAERREVRLGFRQEDIVEVLEGLAEGEELIVLGQDGLADGTPVSLLESENQPVQPAAGEELSEEQIREGGGHPERREDRSQEGRSRDEGSGAGRTGQTEPPQGGHGQGFGPGSGMGRGGGFDPDNIPPFMEERIKDASFEELPEIKERIKQMSGMSDKEIDKLFKKIRGKEQ